MSAGAKNPPPSGDDLFDLPEEASTGVQTRAATLAPGAVESVPSALPVRSSSTAPAGPPMSSIDSTAAAVLEKVRKRPTKDADAPVSPTSAAGTDRARISRTAWLAVGGLALANAATLAFLVADPARRAASPADPATAPALTARVPAPPIPRPAIESSPAPERAARDASPSALPELSALEGARNVLAEAQSDLASGRRSAARARLGRLALTIDAVELTRRDEIRAEIGLLVARSLQEDAEEARRWRR